MPLFDDDDFKHLEPVGTFAYALSRVHIPTSNPDPVALVLKHSGTANERYQSALKSLRLKGKVTEKQHAALFAKHVITDWRHVIKDGKSVAYSVAGGEELLGWLIDKKRSDIVNGAMFAANDADNFETPVADAGDLGNE